MRGGDYNLAGDGRMSGDRAAKMSAGASFPVQAKKRRCYNRRRGTGSRRLAPTIF